MPTKAVVQSPHISTEDMSSIIYHLPSSGIEQDIIYAIREKGVARASKILSIPSNQKLDPIFVKLAMDKINKKWEEIGFPHELYAMSDDEPWSEKRIYYGPREP